MAGDLERVSGKGREPGNECGFGLGIGLGIGRGGAGSFRALALDMDGTMFDSERLIMRMWDETARSFGYVFDESVMISTVGTNGEQTRRILREAYPNAPHEDIRAAMWEAYGRLRDSGLTPIKPGLIETLEAARTLGIPAGVCTSSRRASAEAAVAGAGLMGYISAFVCAYETEKGKPDPAPYLLIAERLGASPGECLAVEDSPAGARSALGAGMTVVVVPDLVPVPDDVAGRAAVAGSLHEVARALLSRSQ